METSKTWQEREAEIKTRSARLVAKQLQQPAQPGEVWISGNTMRPTKSTIISTQDGTVTYSCYGNTYTEIDAFFYATRFRTWDDMWDAYHPTEGK